LHTIRIGVPAETDLGERRVCLLPDSVAALVTAGHAGIVQAGAGQWIHAADDAIRAIGATVAEASADVIEACDTEVAAAPPPGLSSPRRARPYRRRRAADPVPECRTRRRVARRRGRDAAAAPPGDGRGLIRSQV
jgi:hypothetical protein